MCPSVDEWISKMQCTHNEILVSLWKEGNSNTWYKMLHKGTMLNEISQLLKKKKKPTADPTYINS